MIYCLNVYDDTIHWNRAVSPGVDRLAINPDGQLLYVPTWEGGSADYINVLDVNTGEVFRQLHFSNLSHDTQGCIPVSAFGALRPSTYRHLLPRTFGINW